MIDETCSMCGATIYDVSVFRAGTLCSTCRAQSAGEALTPQVPSAIAGTWYESLPDGFRLGASARSWKGFLSLAAGALILPLFVRSEKAIDPWTKVIVALWAITTTWTAVFMLFGQVSVVREGSVLTVSSGVGPFRRRKVSDWTGLTAVHERSIQSGEAAGHEIVLVGAQRAAFGKELNDEQRYFLREVLRVELARGH